MATQVDQALERRIRAALNAAVDLDGLSVTVHVDEGCARLRGEVGSFAERLRAVELATAEAGSGRVHNQLTVRVAGSSWRIPDDELTDSVWCAVVAVGLESGTDTDAVTVEVRGHVVHVAGSVTTEIERAMVRHAAAMVPGVDFVDDRMVVEP
jgi:osmotically-inducible protein OsmY